MTSFPPPDNAATEEELRASQRRYRRVMETAREGVLFLDARARITEANPRLVEMLGYGAEDELVGRSAFDLLFPEDRAAARVRWSARLRGEPEDYELRLRRKDGTECWAAAQVGVERDETGNGVLGTFTLLTDVTERRRAERELAAKSDEVATIFERVSDAFAAFDTEWRFTYVNGGAERLLGRRRADLLGRVIWDELEGARESRVYEEYLRAQREQVPAAFEVYYGPAQGWFEVRAFPSPSGLSAYFTDVTGRKRAEEARQRAEDEKARLLSELQAANSRQRASLAESEERFRLLVEGVRDYAIFLLDPEGRVATWNLGAERFKGYTAHEIIGQHFSRFYTEDDIARRHPWRELEIAAREGRYEEEGWRIRKDGSRFWANVVITALRDGNGELRGFGKVTRDITERRVREQERVTAQLAEQQRRFLRDVLASVTQGRLILCDTPADLPAPVAAEPTGAPVPLTLTSLKSLRSRTQAAAAACGLPAERTHDLVTAVSECAMNAVVHAGGGTARVYAGTGRGVVQVFVEDRGGGIDLSSLPQATLERGFSTGGGGIGHGFWLMLQTCDRVCLLTGPEGTIVVIEQGAVAPVPAWLQK